MSRYTFKILYFRVFCSFFLTEFFLIFLSSLSCDIFFIPFSLLFSFPFIFHFLSSYRISPLTLCLLLFQLITPFTVYHLILSLLFTHHLSFLLTISPSFFLPLLQTLPTLHTKAITGLSWGGQKAGAKPKSAYLATSSLDRGVQIVGLSN